MVAGCNVKALNVLPLSRLILQKLKAIKLPYLPLLHASTTEVIPSAVSTLP
jgi:hypothetical protein